MIFYQSLLEYALWQLDRYPRRDYELILGSFLKESRILKFIPDGCKKPFIS